MPKLSTDRYAEYLRRESLRVVILGPGQAQPDDFCKRQQIRARLKECGYSLARLGEELLGIPSIPLHIALVSELPNIDLLLVLNSGPAPLTELAAISEDWRARQITRVWSRREYQEGGRSTPGDVVGMFVYWPYDWEEFESCELVQSVVESAERFCFDKAQKEGRLIPLGLSPPG